MNAQKIGARLRETRDRRGLSQQAFADALGISRMQVGRIERGVNWLNLEYVDKLAKLLEVSPAFLLCLDDSAVHKPSAADEADRWRVIKTDYQSPAGLRNLASNVSLVETLGIQPEEWEALRALAKTWTAGQTVTRDGWVSILYALRGAAGPPP